MTSAPAPDLRAGSDPPTAAVDALTPGGLVATVPRPPGRWEHALAARLSAIAVLLGVVGLLPWLSGADPARSILRARSAERDPTPEALAAVRADLGLDQGPLRLLGGWLAGLLRGDAGTSWVSGRPVLPSVLGGLGVSLTLMAAALLVALTVAALLAARTLLAGARGAARSGNGVAAAMLTAAPEFLLATVALILGAVWLGWFPPFGWRGPSYVVLPALALGLPAGGLLGRLLDDALPGAFAERWVSTWMAAGVTPPAIALGVLRRCLPALAPQLGLVLVGLTGGAVAVETVFAIPGIGRTALGAAISKDLPVLQASVLALLLLGLAAGGLAELARRRLLGPALRGGALVPPPVEPRAGRWGLAVPAALGAVLLAVMLLGLARDPLTVDVALRLSPPSWEHPLGTDALGRDVLARLGHGALRTAAVAVGVSLLAYVVGLLVSLAPTASGGMVESTNALPPVLAGLLTAAVLGPSVAGAATAVALVSWAPLSAHAAALAQEVRASGHLEASRALGADSRWLFRHHVLPAVVGPVFRHSMLRVPGIALALASLGFLGLGSQPPTPEWGLVLAEALPYVERAPWAALAPALALALLGALAVSASVLSPAAVSTSRRHARTRA